MIAFFVVEPLMLPRHLRREPHLLVFGQADIVRQRQPRVERRHVGPGHHIHWRRAARVHCHIGKAAVVVQVVVQSQVVALSRRGEKAVEPRRLAASRHIHMNLDVGPLRVVHFVGDVVVVNLRFPTRPAKQMPD